MYRSVMVTPSEQSITSDHFFNNTNEGILKGLHHCLENGEDVKVYATTSITFIKVNFQDGNVDEEKTFYFVTKATPIQTATDVKDLVEIIRNKEKKQKNKSTG